MKTLKKNFWYVCAIIIALAILSIPFVMVGGIITNYETKPKTVPESRIIEATVIGASADLNVNLERSILFEDWQGNCWSAKVHNPSLVKGQKVKLEINTNKTETLADDKIVEIWLI